MPNKGWFTLLRLYSPLEPFGERNKRERDARVDLAPERQLHEMQQPRQVRTDQRFLTRVDRVVEGLDLALG